MFRIIGGGGNIATKQSNQVPLTDQDDMEDWYQVNPSECVPIDRDDIEDWHQINPSEYKKIDQGDEGKKLERYRVQLSEEYIKETIRNGTFSSGGAHKKFQNGILKADQKASKDFKVENMIGYLLEARPSLGRYISLQQEIDVSADIARGFHYAQVPTYARGQVSSTSLATLIPSKDCSGKLIHEEVKSLALEFVNMLREFYLAGLAHRDLHMYNLLVYSIAPESGSSSPSLMLKAIDFGKAKKFNTTERKYCFDDLKYIFKMEACGFSETIVRNYLRKSDNPKQQKHYPLHRLLDLAGVKDTKKFLTEVGDELIGALTVCQDEASILTEFNVAKGRIDGVLN